MDERAAWTAGAIFALLAVAIGAFGAHVLQHRLTPEMLNVFEIGARYQMYHGLGLFAVAVAAQRWPNRFTKAAAWFFVAGVIFFSGSLYLLALTGATMLGAVAPIGGAAFLAGWTSLLLGVRSNPGPR